MITLNSDTNYIVSGIERSGTSMMMQILTAGGIPVAFDETRKPDESNPKGYYELEGGKIINTLIKGTFPFDTYKGQFIKITAFGLSYLPDGRYKIIYMERNVEEVLDSMEKMAKITNGDRKQTRDSFWKLNETIKRTLTDRDDIEVLHINYNHILKNPKEDIEKLSRFLGIPDIDTQAMEATIDHRLYRQRRHH